MGSGVLSAEPFVMPLCEPLVTQPFIVELALYVLFEAPFNALTAYLYLMPFIASPSVKSKAVVVEILNQEVHLPSTFSER